MLVDKGRSARFGLSVVAVLGASTICCNHRDCTSVQPGDRSVNGAAAFRFDAGLIEMDLATVWEFQHLHLESDPPISEQHLKLSWTAPSTLGETKGQLVRLLIDIDGISGAGEFDLEELDAIACGCPPEAFALDDSDAEPRCAFHADDSSEYSEPALCEALAGKLTVQTHDLVCSSDGDLCAPRQAFDLVVEEQSGGRFSADIQVRWIDVVHEARCTDSMDAPSTGVG